MLVQGLEKETKIYTKLFPTQTGKSKFFLKINTTQKPVFVDPGKD